MTVIREPAVAGMFYPGNADELASSIRAFFEHADAGAGPAPKAVIAPHAGYMYSGAVAANAYARLLPYRDQYSRVVLLGPCHRVPVKGLALSGADAFRTPLGDVPLDRQAIASLDFPEVTVFDATHEFEHSLEVHLPLLQEAIGSFTLVPIVVGDVAPEIVADVLDALWDGPETLIVISSDLSHYLQYDAARSIDQATCEAIENLDEYRIGHHCACGATAVNAMLIAAKRRELSVTTLDLRNSGDTAGDKGRVVGYGAWMFVERNPS